MRIRDCRKHNTMKKKKRIAKFHIANMKPKDYFTWVEASNEFKHVGILKSSDRLIKYSENILNPIIHDDIDILVYTIPKAYIDVALSIIKLIKVINDGKLKRKHAILIMDSYIYPALFCFRLYVELKIKYSIQYYKGKIKDGEEALFLKKHDLSLLWKSLSEYIDKKDNEYEEMTVLINEIQTLDENSERFRYPFIFEDIKDIKGKRRIIKTHPVQIQKGNDCIDINNLYEMILKIYRYLEKINLKANKEW